jgi:hypothetical protein
MKWLLAHRFAVVALVTAVPLPLLGYLLGQNWLTLIVAFGALPLADWWWGRTGATRRLPTKPVGRAIATAPRRCTPTCPCRSG